MSSDIGATGLLAPPPLSVFAILHQPQQRHELLRHHDPLLYFLFPQELSDILADQHFSCQKSTISPLKSLDLLHLSTTIMSLSHIQALAWFCLLTAPIFLSTHTCHHHRLNAISYHNSHPLLSSPDSASCSTLQTARASAHTY